MESFFDTKHLYRSYFKMALPVVLGAGGHTRLQSG